MWSILGVHFAPLKWCYKVASFQRRSKHGTWKKMIRLGKMPQSFEGATRRKDDESEGGEEDAASRGHVNSREHGCALEIDEMMHT